MGIFKIDLSKELAFLKSLLSSHTKRAYLVGGGVRDALLAIKSSDFDVELYDISEKKLAKIMKELGANPCGKSFFVYKYKNYDFALARYEYKKGPKHRDFEVSLCFDERKAAKRRDFSINALMLDIFDEKILDFYKGLEDLKARKLRHIDDKSFVEDELRVLRALSFSSRFSFKIDKKTLALMQTMSLEHLSKDRIKNELYKFFKGKNLALGFFYIEKLGLSSFLFCKHESKKEFFFLLKAARQNIEDEGLFLYLFLNYFHIDKKAFFKERLFKKSLCLKANQPFYKELDAFCLCKIALLMPLQSFLGLYKKKDIILAKKLSIYDKKLSFRHDLKTLAKKGFKGKALGEKIKSLNEEKIRKYIKEKNV